MSDAHFLVSNEVIQIDLKRRQDQDNLVRIVARDIAQNNMSVIFQQDNKRFCSTARMNMRRLRSLGFRVVLDNVYYVDNDSIHSPHYESMWIITLPQL
jgi:hypothetical protein